MYEQTFSYEAHGQTLVIHLPKELDHHNCRNLKYATAKFPQAFIERKDVTYSYEDGDLYHFMDNETYDDIPVNASDVPDNFKFCKENELCKLLSYKGKVFSVEIPNFIELEVTQTEPGVKGNTATNTLKPATVETGAEIRVPLFINEGDHIRIDTRTGEYMERV